MKGALGAATKWIPKSKTCKICPENECFVRLLWELFGVHLGWSLFVRAHRGCSNATLKSAKKCLKIMVWEIFWDPFGGIHLDFPVSASVPMQRGARFSFRRIAPMQRGARFLFRPGVPMQRGTPFSLCHLQHFGMLPPFLLCFIRILLCNLQITKENQRISVCCLGIIPATLKSCTR